MAFWVSIAITPTLPYVTVPEPSRNVQPQLNGLEKIGRRKKGNKVFQVVIFGLSQN